MTMSRCEKLIFSLGGLAALVFLLAASLNTSAQVTVKGVQVPSPVEIAQSGERTGSTYKNRLLSFTLAIPQEWSFASDEINKRMLAEGRERMNANETAERKESYERSMANTAVLFTLTKHAAGDPRNGAHLAAGFERTSPTTTARAYADHNKNLVITKSNAGRLINDVSSLRLDGREVFAFDIEATENSLKIRQTYYVLHHKGGMLFFIVTWVTGGEDQQKAMEKVIRSADFDS